MQLKITSKEDFYAGLMFVGFGILAVVVSRDYPMGTAMRMGPGYFPTCLGGLLIVLGSIVSFSGFRVAGEGITPFAWKPIIMLGLAFAVFGWGIDHLGFVPSLVAVTMLSAAGGKRFNLLEVILLGAGMALLCTAIFVWGIELPFRLFWWS